MAGILTVLLTVLCISFYTGQTFLNRMFSGSYPGAAETASPVFSGIYGIVVAAVTFCLNGFRFSPSWTTVMFGLGNGVILFLYNLGMIQAARRGPYTFQSIVMLFGSIVVCLLADALFWGDRITPMQLCGIALMLAAFVALNAGGLKFAGIRKGYFFWVFSLFLTNGFYGVLMDSQQRMVPAERNEMIILTFASLTVISQFYLFGMKRETVRNAYAMGKRTALYAFLSSLCAAFAVYLLMVLLKHIPSYILYTVNNGSILVLSALLSSLILKETMTGAAMAGIGLSVISIVLLSL